MANQQNPHAERSAAALARPAIRRDEERYLAHERGPLRPMIPLGEGELPPSGKLHPTQSPASSLKDNNLY